MPSTGANQSADRPSNIVVGTKRVPAQGIQPPRANGQMAACLNQGGVAAQATDGKAGAAWLTRLIAADGPGIIRMLWRILHREADVSDAFQDMCCKLAALRDPSSLNHAKAYAYRTAANTAIEMIRSRSRRALHFATIVQQRQQGDCEETATADEGFDRLSLERAIAELPTHLRQVVILRDLGRMPYREVGRLLDIDPATARVYRRHAVVRLAELMHVNPVACAARRRAGDV